MKPEDLIHLSLPSFMDLIKDLGKEHQEVCREIRRKGRNKIHALKCRKKSRDEVSRLQVSQNFVSVLEIIICVIHRNRLRGRRRKGKDSWKTTNDFSKTGTTCINFTNKRSTSRNSVFKVSFKKQDSGQHLTSK